MTVRLATSGALLTLADTMRSADAGSVVSRRILPHDRADAARSLHMLATVTPGKQGAICFNAAGELGSLDVAAVEALAEELRG